MHQLKLLSYKCVQKKVKLISDSLGQTKKKMWWWWRRKDNRNIERGGKWGASYKLYTGKTTSGGGGEVGGQCGVGVVWREDD